MPFLFSRAISALLRSFPFPVPRHSCPPQGPQPSLGIGRWRSFSDNRRIQIVLECKDDKL